GFHGDLVSVDTTIVTGPPQFAVLPKNMTLAPGGSAPLSVTAIIPNSATNFTWTAVPDATKPWLSVASGPYAGSRDVTVLVEPGTADGLSSNISVDSVPPFAAPNIESGPLTVAVTVGKPLSPAGVLLAGGQASGQVLDTAEVYDEASASVVPVGKMNSPREF